MRKYALLSASAQLIKAISDRGAKVALSSGSRTCQLAYCLLPLVQLCVLLVTLRLHIACIVQLGCRVCCNTAAGPAPIPDCMQQVELHLHICAVPELVCRNGA